MNDEHVTAGGYVASCGFALEVGAGYTMLSGWIPDAILRLREVALDRRLLGVWHGRPTSALAELIGGWSPTTV